MGTIKKSEPIWILDHQAYAYKLLGWILAIVLAECNELRNSIKDKIWIIHIKLLAN